MSRPKNPNLYEIRICELDSCNTQFEVKKSRGKRYCSKSCSNSDPKTKDKIRAGQTKTFHDKYGCHPMQTESTKKNHQKSIKKKYGVTHIGAIKGHDKKVKQTKLDRYGDANYNNTKQTLNTKLVKYGDSQYRDMKGRRDVIWTRINEWTHVTPKFERIDLDNGIGEELRFKFQCNTCMHTWDSRLHGGYVPGCKPCSLKHNSSPSKGELELRDFIESVITGAEFNNRTVLPDFHELDIYIPSKKLAFEYNGLYWHSDEHKHKNYHLTKTKHCSQKGIQLIHIFEHQWKLNQELVKSMILSKLAPENLISVFGRKTKVVELKSKQKKEFNNLNHIQGDCNSSINLGLMYNDELVACMTFGRPRYSKGYDYELLRFCNLKGYRVVGGFDKLMKYFETTYKPSSIISYTDRSRSNGDVYLKTGWEFVNVSKPSYFYFKGMNVFHRHKFQKHTLSKSLENFDSTLTEVQNVKNHGYLRYWDCGQFLFKKDFT